MDNARQAMAGLADNMEALKHNILLRGFFRDRGYFDLSRLSAAEYRKGALTNGGARREVRVWLGSSVLFAPPGPNGERRLTDDGKARLDSAIAPYLPILPDALFVVEGYAQHGSGDERFLESRARAETVRDYLIGTFHLDPQRVGVMPLAARSAGSPGGTPWDGVALAVFAEPDVLEGGK
jgi:hypothetical protein